MQVSSDINCLLIFHLLFRDINEIATLSFNGMKLALIKARRDQPQKLGPCFIIGKLSCKRRSGGHGVLFLHPSHRHAEVFAFNYHGYTCRFQCLLDTVTYLVRKPLLYLKTACIYVHYTRYFAEAYNMTIRDIRHVGFPKKGKHMML